MSFPATRRPVRSGETGRKAPSRSEEEVSLAFNQGTPGRSAEEAGLGEPMTCRKPRERGLASGRATQLDRERKAGGEPRGISADGWGS